VISATTATAAASTMVIGFTTTTTTTTTGAAARTASGGGLGGLGSHGDRPFEGTMPIQGVVIVLVDGAGEGRYQVAGLMAVQVGLAHPCEVGWFNVTCSGGRGNQPDVGVCRVIAEPAEECVPAIKYIDHINDVVGYLA
jgi:hypothetical protein